MKQVKVLSKALCSSHLQSNTAHTLRLTSAFHTAATIYPSVTPISAKLAPFISKAAVRDTYYTETLSPRHAYTHPLKDREPCDYFISRRCENPCQINAQFFQVNHSFTPGGKGSSILRCRNNSVYFSSQTLVICHLESKKQILVWCY